MFRPNPCPLVVRALVASVATLVLIPISARAETWNLGTGSSWDTASNWNPANVPNSVGAAVIFNGAATAENPAQTANRPITLDGGKTVGSILFNTDLGSFTNTISVGSGGPLTFDAVDAGPATITTTGGGTGNNTISAAMSLTDSIVATVDNTTASSAAGSLNFTGAMSGPGGFTKQGDGLATFGTGAKTYAGPTILSGGRMRISEAAHPSATSSFTVNPGAQLTPITTGTYTFGAGPLNLNGSGATSGPFAVFPGAIRQDTSRDITINNHVVLQSDTLLHVQGAGTGWLRFPNTISGPGSLTLTAPAHDANLGALVLSGANTYAGGTIVNGGDVRLSGLSASLGSGDVIVLSAHSAFFGSSARLTIETGVLDAIANTAALSLTGGNVPGFADDGYVFLDAGVNEFVGSLLLGGFSQEPGTYGSTASGAQFPNDEFFAGTGVVTVVPEPSAAVALLAGFGALAAARRRRR